MSSANDHCLFPPLFGSLSGKWVSGSERLQNETFDLILMDVQMPVMSPLDATIEIRRREQVSGHQVPIYAMTANAMKSDRERYISIGRDGYLAQPIRPQELDQLLHEVRSSLPDHTK